MGLSQNSGYYFGGPHDKDDRILGSILGSLHFGKVLYHVKQGSRGAMRNSASVQALKLSENGGSPIQTPKYYNPYHGNPQNSTQNFGKAPYSLIR